MSGVSPSPLAKLAASSMISRFAGTVGEAIIGSVVFCVSVPSNSAEVELISNTGLQRPAGLDRERQRAHVTGKRGQAAAGGGRCRRNAGENSGPLSTLAAVEPNSTPVDRDRGVERHDE